MKTYRHGDRPASETQAGKPLCLCASDLQYLEAGRGESARGVEAGRGGDGKDRGPGERKSLVKANPV